MTFSIKGLGLLAYAHQFTLWHYATEDTTEEVQAENYFKAAGDTLKSGDRIACQTGDRLALDLVVDIASERYLTTKWVGGVLK